jgi:hypothetical protein
MMYLYNKLYFLYRPILSAVLQILKMHDFSAVTKISAEDLAILLLEKEAAKYKLTIDTPNLSRVVLRILETQSIERQKEVLSAELIRAAIDKDDRQKIMNLIEKSNEWREICEETWQQFYLTQESEKIPVVSQFI